MKDAKDIEAWADALLDQHRTAPRRARDSQGRVPLSELDPMTRLMVEAGAAPLPARAALTVAPPQADEWVGKAQTMAMVLVGVLLVGLVLALAAGS